MEPSRLTLPVQRGGFQRYATSRGFVSNPSNPARLTATMYFKSFPFLAMGYPHCCLLLFAMATNESTPTSKGRGAFERLLVDRRSRSAVAPLQGRLSSSNDGGPR